MIICIPTPLNANREPDLSFVTSTLDSIKPYLRDGQTISLEKHDIPWNNQRCDS